MAAKLIQAIEVDEVRGDGTERDPYRRVAAYYSADGNLLAVSDPDERMARASLNRNAWTAANLAQQEIARAEGPRLDVLGKCILTVLAYLEGRHG